MKVKMKESEFREIEADSWSKYIEGEDWNFTGSFVFVRDCGNLYKLTQNWI